MKISDFRKAGHTPSLIAAFLYFDVSFMAWVLLALGIAILNETIFVGGGQVGFLAGAVFVLLGILRIRALRP